MNHTLRDIAMQTGLNKVTIFNHYKRLRQNDKHFMEKHIKRSKNRILLDNKAYEKILNSFNHIHINVKSNVNHKADLTVVKILKSELSDKDTRISELNKQNANLNELLKHQQELQLGEQRKNKALTQTLNKTLTYHENKHGFWYRLRHLFK